MTHMTDMTSTADQRRCKRYQCWERGALCSSPCIIRATHMMSSSVPSGVSNLPSRFGHHVEQRTVAHYLGHCEPVDRDLVRRHRKGIVCDVSSASSAHRTAIRLSYGANAANENQNEVESTPQHSRHTAAARARATYTASHRCYWPPRSRSWPEPRHSRASHTSESLCARTCVAWKHTAVQRSAANIHEKARMHTYGTRMAHA